MSTDMPPNVEVLDRFADGAARRFVDWVQATVRSRGVAHVALAGGSTPRSVHKALASPPHRDAAPWPAVHVYQGDERAVGPSHPDSNWNMACQSLLDRVGLPADNRCRMLGEADDLHRAADAYADQLRARLPIENGAPTFDLILLGLGTDGHTASLFPDTDALKETKRFVVANAVPRLGTTRLTLTYPALSAAREIWFLVSGSAKASVAARVINEPDCPLPAARVHPAAGTGRWLLDAGAAEQL